jgi:hypothetical protein
MASKIKVDKLETADGTGTIALQNQLSGMTTASLPTVTTDKLGAGAVLQVVSSIFETDTSTSSTSYVTTGHSVTLTPSSTSSKVYVTLQGGGGWVAAGSWLKMTIYRGGTNLGNSNTFTAYSSSGDQNVSHSMAILDSPSTTSATTYTIYFRTNTGTPQYRWSDKGNPVLTAMEIAG